MNDMFYSTQFIHVNDDALTVPENVYNTVINRHN